MSTEQTDKKLFADVGCYVDGALGEDHRRETLALMVGAIAKQIAKPCATIPEDSLLCKRLRAESASAYKVVMYLQAKPSHDYSEEQDAIEILQDHTADGLTWIMEAGDLILTDEA